MKITKTKALLVALAAGVAGCGPMLADGVAVAALATAAPKPSIEAIRTALLKDDPAFFQTFQDPNRLEMGNLVEQAGDLLEASALFGAFKVFQFLLKQVRPAELAPARQAHLLNLCIRSLPYEALPEADRPAAAPSGGENARKWREFSDRAQAGKARILASLLKQGWPVDVPDASGLTPTQQAALSANLPALKSLLAAGGRVSQASEPGQLAKDQTLADLLKTYFDANALLEHALDQGAKLNSDLGFEWWMIRRVLDRESEGGDALFLRLLRQDLPMPSKDWLELANFLMDFPPPRALTLLLALHAKAGSLVTIPDRHDLLRRARQAKDARVYPHIVEWLGPLDEDEKSVELSEAIEAADPERSLPVIQFWLHRGQTPYAPSAKGGRNAVEKAWNAGPRIFVPLLETLATCNLLQPKDLNHLLDSALTCLNMEMNPADLRAKLDALEKVGVSLKPFAQHPLWSRPTDELEPGSSFFNLTPGAAAALFEVGKRGVNLNRDFEGEPFLVGYFTHSVCWAGEQVAMARSVDLIREVLRQGASLNQPVKGATLLHHAASSGQVEVAKLFLEAGLAVNSTLAPLKGTPLMWAVRDNQTAMVQWLLAHGADPNLATVNGWSALGMANYLKDKNPNIERKNIIESLQRAGALSLQPAALKN